MNIILPQSYDGATANINTNLKEDRQCTCEEKLWRVRVSIVSGKVAMPSVRVTVKDIKILSIA
jgi:hypothetical protein